MKYWFDTEFIENGKTIDLISIGIVAEDGRKYYAVSSQFNSNDASQWVKDNVIVHLPVYEYRKTRSKIADEVKEFINCEKPEIWAYYADYDWVAFCQLFGTMMDLPKGYPMYCRDIKQLCDSLGNPKLPEQESLEHHALNDALWTKQAWHFLEQYKESPRHD
jgi:hypothetical protein